MTEHVPRPEAGHASAAEDTSSPWNGCSICRALQEDEFRFLTQLQGALAQDPGVHEAVAAEGGFCNHHMWYLSRLATDPLVTRLVGAIVRTALDRIGDRDLSGPGVRLLGRLGASCRVCRSLHEQETAYVQAFMERASAGAGESERLCLPHLVRASALCDRPALLVHWRRLREIAEHFVQGTAGGRFRVQAGAAVILSHGHRGMLGRPSTDPDPPR